MTQQPAKDIKVVDYAQLAANMRVEYIRLMANVAKVDVALQMLFAAGESEKHTDLLIRQRNTMKESAEVILLRYRAYREEVKNTLMAEKVSPLYDTPRRLRQVNDDGSLTDPYAFKEEMPWQNATSP